MAIIASHTAVLDALNEEVIFGPGEVEIYTDDTDTILLHIVATSGTWTIAFTWSLDGVNYYSSNLFPLLGGAPATSLSASATTFNNMYTWPHSNIPYLKMKMTSYTDGVVTVNAASRRTLTR